MPVILSYKSADMVVTRARTDRFKVVENVEKVLAVFLIFTGQR